MEEQDFSNLNEGGVDNLPEPENEQKSKREGNEAYLLSRRRKWLERAILVVAGIIFSAAFPDLNWTLLGWIGLIPLFIIIRNKTPFQAWRCGYLWGFFWSSAAFFWLGEIEYFNYPFRPLVLSIQNVFPSFPGGLCLPYMLALILALFPAFWAMLVPMLCRGLLVPVAIRLEGWKKIEDYEKKSIPGELLLVLALASWWCILEWVRSWIATGLPWNFLAVSQWQNLALIQICEFTGIYGVSFLLALVNISLALTLLGWFKSYQTGKYRRPYPLIMSLMLLMISVMIGSKSMWNFNKQKDEIPFSAVCVQGNMEQCRQASEEKANEALNRYISLSELGFVRYTEFSENFLNNLKASSQGKDLSMTAAQIAAVTKPDLVIWPETASPVPFRSSWVYQYRLTSLIKKYKIPFLIGTIDFEDVTDGDGRAQKMYNSAFYFNRKAQLEDKFSKVHIVPFGEFVPFVDWFPFLEKVIGMGRGLTPGKGFNVIEVAPGVKAGVNICFEDVFPYVSRAFARNGANLLIVITNDAWYPKTSEPEQHLANSIFRAVENRRPMLRCGNNSCTCLITPEGRVIANSDYEFDKVLDKFIRLPNSREGLDAANKRGRNIFNFAFGVKKSPSMTFYTRFGDVFIFVCWLIFGGAIMQVLWRWREEKQMLKLAFEEPP